MRPAGCLPLVAAAIACSCPPLPVPTGPMDSPPPPPPPLFLPSFPAPRRYAVPTWQDEQDVRAGKKVAWDEGGGSVLCCCLQAALRAVHPVAAAPAVLCAAPSPAACHSMIALPPLPLMPL